MDERKKILLALQSVSELSNKKRTALLDEFEDATELASESGRRAVFKTLGDEHATEFFKLLDRADELAAELEKRDLKFITRYDDEYPEKLLDIYDAPTGLFAKGNLDALREMPHALVISPEDVLDQMGVRREEQVEKTIELSIVQTEILDALHDGERHFEELIEVTGLSVSELTSVLFDLEIEGMVFKGAGNFYSLA